MVVIISVLLASEAIVCGSLRLLRARTSQIHLSLVGVGNYRALPRPQRGRGIHVNQQGKLHTLRMDFTSENGAVRGRGDQHVGV